MVKSMNGDTESAFNEGMLQIQRLHNLWEQANRQSRRPSDRLFTDWRFTLETVWRELSRDAVKEGTPDLEITSFSRIGETNDWFKTEKELQEGINKADTPFARYKAISQYEMFLRLLQDRVGKGGKFRDKDEDDMD